MTAPRTHQRRGFTLIELMVGLVIFAVLAAIAVPSMTEMIARKRVEGAVDELLVDFRQAKTSQMTINLPVIIKFNANASMTCYTIFEKVGAPQCDCRNTDPTPVCSSEFFVAPREFKTARYPSSTGITVAPEANSLNRIQLDNITGLPLGGNTLKILVSAPNGGAVRVSTNSAGIAQACSVSGHDTAYKPCPP